MANTTTDYYTQVITFGSINGPISVPLADINDWNLYVVQVCVNYGSQIGASIAMLLALLLLSKPEKRLSAIILLNTLSLLFNIIRNVLQCVYFTGPFAGFYPHFAGDYRRVRTTDTAQSVTATVFTLLMQISVESSLLLQVRVVCVTLRPLYRRIIFTISVGIAVAAVAIRFAYVVMNDILIVQQRPTLLLASMSALTNIVLSACIFWFCAIFVGKLAYALHQRKKMGLGQFGPMQILIIMGCQTLIIPAAFSIIQFWGPPGLAAYTLTASALFLPLSSLWASASLDSKSNTTRSDGNALSFYPSGFSNASTKGKTSSGPLSPSNTVTTVCLSGHLSPKDWSAKEVDQDLEKQGLAGTGDFVNSKV